MTSLALVMIVRNEEEKIERCLNSVSAYVDDIIVVDTGSTDSTVEAAKKSGARVFEYAWNDDFAEARNYALSLSSSKWNLILDADEYVVDFQMDHVRGFMESSGNIGRVQIVSETLVEGEKSEVRNLISRLLPQGVRFQGRIHEQVTDNLPRVKVPILIKHDGYMETNKASRNIPLLLKECQDNPLNPYYYYQLGKEFKGISQLEECEQYLNKAYLLLNGTERYAPNVVVDYLYTLIAMKQLIKAKDIIDINHRWIENFPDYHFVCGVFYLDLILSDVQRYSSYVPRIAASYRRCLEIGESDEYDSVIGTGSFAAWYNLGNYHEVIGQRDDALFCYRMSADLGYKRAVQRLSELT